MKIHKEGFTSILVVFIFALLLTYITYINLGNTISTWIIGALLWSFAIFVVSFFRAPKRYSKGDAFNAVAPADGKIVIIDEVEETEYFHEKVIQVSIFMSFFNVHMNWYPITGNIEYYKYHPGNYVAAFHPKSSTKNERTTIVIKNEQEDEILMRQIAGLVARRVVCYANYGDSVKSGDEAGFIKFGSRADLFFPLGTEICVKKGDKVTGGETIIAKLPKK